MVRAITRAGSTAACADVNELEARFAESVKDHAAEIKAAYQTVCALSEKHGVPFGSYVPASFFDKFGGYESDHDWISINPGLVADLCPMDNGWLNSTTECEFYE